MAAGVLLAGWFGCATDAPAPAPSPAPVAEAAPAASPPATPTAIARPTPAAAAGDGLVNGATAPDFDLPVVGGTGTWKLSDHVAADGHGSANGAIVSFSASWCGPCRASLPTLAEIATAHPDLVIVLLNIDEQESGRQKELVAMKDAGLTTGVLVVADRDTQRAWLGEQLHIPRFFVLNKVAEVMVQDRGFGDKVRPMLPKQVNYAIAHPAYTAR
jgi:thiol-disulfide isomerase/thioredoxin